MEYDFIEQLTEDCIILLSKYGSQTWISCKVRKQHKCRITKRIISVGETAFRPLTNGYNRMHRVSYIGINILTHRGQIKQSIMDHEN